MEDKILSVIVLAAGRGKRMCSKVPKVLHHLLGKSMLSYVIEAAWRIRPREIIGVVSPEVLEVVSEWEVNGPISWVVQSPPQGTADAVRCGLSRLSPKAKYVMILPGDVPLVRPETLAAMVAEMESSGEGLVVLGTKLNNPYGYGRIVTDEKGDVLKIVEERDANESERTIHLINTGIMVFERARLMEELKGVGTDNAQGEFYLTDLAALFREGGIPVKSVLCEDPLEVSGINDRRQLSEVQKDLLGRLIRRWQEKGVTFVNPETIYLEQGAILGRDTAIDPGVVMRGKVRVGEGCRIGVGSVIENTLIEDGVEIRPYSVIEESVIRSGAVVGPFAHLRPGSDIGNNAKVGNFVEVKKSRLAPGVKASHLTYLGDATIGEDTNIGAGTITCNYDGKRKHPTTIGKNVFVGSNTAFVAPVTIGDNATIAAGSVITKPIPEGTLGVARARQQNIYRRHKRKKDA